jgi:HSP20 family molecular chaperone IbpA
MADSDIKAIKVKEKQEVAAPAEHTRPGLIFVPNVDIFETKDHIAMMADVPGVKPEGISIDLKEGTLTLSADIAPFEGPNEEDILIEYETGKYFRQFSLSEIINQSKIDAKLKDGVLQLTLPKVEKAKPRKIEIKSE